MKKISIILIAAIMAVMTFAFAGCGNKAEQADADVSSTSVSDIEYVKTKGKLVVGITDYQPMNYKENGEWVGFDTELTKAFGKKIGVAVEFVEIDWDNKFTELKSKSIDCIWNGMTITDEALNNSSVSEAYLSNSQVVIMKAGTTVASVEDLKGKNFAVEQGSAGEAAANDNSLENTVVSTQANALLEVKSGSCDGCIIDKTMADATVGEGTSYADLANVYTLSKEDFGVSFRQQSDLTSEFNTFVKEYKESGKFKELADKYEVAVED